MQTNRGGRAAASYRTRGETENDFAETMKLIEDIGFDQSFSFIYSARPGTPASSMPDLVPLEEKKDTNLQY